MTNDKFINIKKIADYERKLRLTYYYESGSVVNRTFPNKASYDEAMNEFMPYFILVNGIWYNSNKIETVNENGLTVDIIFYDKSELKKTFTKQEEVEVIIDKVSNSFIKMTDGTWYNSKQLEKVDSNKDINSITYLWMKEKLITVRFQDDEEFEEALEKIDELDDENNKVEDVDFTPAKEDPSKSKVPIIKGSTVELTCETPTAVIYYTTDGSKPTFESPIYKEPIVIEKDTTVTAIAVNHCSDFVSIDYQVVLPTVATPEFNPVEGEIESGTEVEITCATENAMIYYTTDGTKPTTKSDVYKEPIVVKEDVTIKAIGVKKEYTNSEVVTASYTIAKPHCEAPIFNPDNSQVESGTEIIITASPSDAIIYYTTDGKDPTEESDVYKDPIVIKENITFKAIAIKKDFYTSPITTKEYTIVEKKNKSDE